MSDLALPPAFVWTRFGSEAGETIHDILSRKERERIANGGTFWWGIGNSVGRAVSLLCRELRGGSPSVIFSPIVGPARLADSNPSGTVRWTRAEDWLGFPVKIPVHTHVTSRESRKVHYALVCRSAVPLALRADRPPLSIRDLTNLESGSPVGASQTTAVVRLGASRAPARAYPVALHVELTDPYFVRLTENAPL